MKNKYLGFCDCSYDDNDFNDCVYAQILNRSNKGKEDCEYWRKIK